MELFVLGVPGAGWADLSRALDRRAGVALLVGFSVPSVLARLRAATHQRATDWLGLAGGEVPWLDGALDRFAHELVAALRSRALLARRARAECFGTAHEDNALAVDLLAELFPDARFCAWIRSGLRAPRALFRREDDAHALARAGVAWARAWTAHVGPIERVATKLGPRLCAVCDDDPHVAWARAHAFAVEASGAAPADRASIPVELAPRGVQLDELLAGPARAGFLAHAPARRWMNALGFDVPPIDPEWRSLPAVAIELARGFMADGCFDEADAVLAGVESLDAAVLCASADIALARGERDLAAQRYGYAITRDRCAIEAWEKLFQFADADTALEFSAEARTSEEPRVRAALARWLVARGLDAEAAEIVGRVEHSPW